MASRPGSQVVTGTTKVETAQTAVQLTTTAPSTLTPICLGVLVQADPSNTGEIVAIGDKNVNAKKTLGTTRGTVLEKKQLPVRIEISDPTQLWIDAEKSKDAVIWTVIVG
jgi:hypothetical protein